MICSTFPRRGVLVMIVLSPNHVDVQRHACSHGKRVEDVRQHLRGEVANLLSLQLQVCDAEWTGRDVDDCPSERLTSFSMSGPPRVDDVYLI